MSAIKNNYPKYVSLGDVFKVSSGGTPSRTKSEYFGGDIPWVKTGDLKGVYANKPKEFITQVGLENSSAKLFPPSTVLLAMYGATIGACSILSFEAATNQACAAILPSENYNEKYLYYYFSYIKPSLIRMGVGGAQPNISAGLIKKLKVPNLSLEEQKKITEILDAANSLKQKDQQLVEHYDRLSQSLFLDMFGDPVQNPKKWEQLSLEDMVDFLTSGSRGWAKYYSDTGDIFIRIQNVGKNKLMIDDITYVNAPNNAESKRTAVQAGDILLSITADLGRTAVIPKDFPKAHINQHLAIIRLKKGYNPDYVSEFIASEGGKRQFMKLDKGGVKAGLNFTDIKSLKLLNPPMEVQNEYLNRVKNIKQQKLIAEKSLMKSNDLFNSLLQKAFKGELTAS